MLLSAVSVLVVAQSSSEIPEGLMNNPVYQNTAALTHVSRLSVATSTLQTLRDTTQGETTRLFREYPGY